METPEFRSPPKRIILGNLNQNGGSPVSPMANLKLLTKVATSHYSTEENKPHNEVQMQICDSKGETKPSRRFRSLSFICKKFLLLYKLDIPLGESQQISLGNLALTLGIEKRRVYDIINVVSSLHMAVKVCKDKYNWFGNQNLPRLLSQLKEYAIINKIDEQICSALKKQLTDSSIVLQESESPYVQITQGDKSVFEENRIGVLCQKFIMLFLVCNEDIPLNMCLISKLILTGDVQDKTGMRRLYDIANILEALDLIQRFNSKIMKKPSFKYCGPPINLNKTDCNNVTREWPLIPQVLESSDQGDTNSDSSLDYTSATSKLDSILEVVCTELEETNSHTPLLPVSSKSDFTNPIVLNARKNLFPSLFPLKTCDTPKAFIKIPKRSFRLELNELQIKDPSIDTNDQILLPSINEKKSTIIVNRDHKIFKTNFNTFGRLVNNFSNNEKLNCISEKNAHFPLKFATDNTDILTNSLISNGTIPSTVPRKIKVLHPKKISEIQDGGIYKVIKKGNTVQLYEL